MVGPTTRTLSPEDELAHYKVVGPLGAGGMGEVYVARDQKLDRNVAIKILPPELVRDEDRVRRFVLEARSASSLSHPNIVTIYEIGQSAVRSPDGLDSSPLHFISMELVSGKTLGTLIHEDRTDLRTLLGFLAQAADGIAKAHAAGIVHRDLKPGNIMVSSDGFSKVLDFGLAKLTEKREVGPDISSAPTQMPDATREGIVFGTAGYMSPEQVRGMTVDHRSDIFSFGCILYEATTRRRPFAADTAVETMHKVLNEKPTPVEELNAEVPSELRRLIRRCLAKSADQRLQSMKDVALELREIVDEYETLSASSSSGSQHSGVAPAAPPRRTPSMAWIGAALLGAAAIAGGWWALQRGRTTSQPYQEMRVSTQTSRGDLTDCVISPDGRFLAYLAGEPGHMSLRVRQVATGSDVDVLPSADVRIFNPSFSPDGNYLFYTAARPDNPRYRALYQVPSLGGQPRERAFDVDSRVSFAPNGKELVFWRGIVGENVTKLIVLDLESGKERELASVTFQEAVLGGPQWSPDGKRIATSLLRPAPNLQSTIAMFDPVSGKRQDFVRIERTPLESIAWLNDGSALISCATDFAVAVTPQVFLHSYPGGRKSRITNDFNNYSRISTSLADATIAAIRQTTISNIWIVDTSVPSTRRITSVANPENSGFLAGAVDSVTIIYAASDDQYMQIWAMGVSGEGAHTLTSGNAHSFSETASSGVIVFVRVTDAGMHVWRMNSDGSGMRQLTAGGGGSLLGLSRDGRIVLCQDLSAPGTVLTLSTEDGRELRRDKDAQGVIGPSPDGRSLLLGAPAKDERGLTTTRWGVVPTTGGEPTVSFQFPEQAFGMAWAPDGQSATFLNRADAGYNVYRQPFAGGAPQAVTRLTDGRLVAHAWSPDGRRLALRVRSGQDENVWVTDADGNNAVRVTEFSSTRIFGMAWMPDSRRIALSAGTHTSDAVLIRGFQ